MDGSTKCVNDGQRVPESHQWHSVRRADSLPFTIREKTGGLRFSKPGLDEYFRNHRKLA